MKGKFLSGVIYVVLCLAFIFQPFIVTAASDIFLYTKTRGDLAYETAREIEVARPGVYVVSVRTVELLNGQAATGVHWTFDHEIYEPWRQAQREAGNNAAVAQFVAEANRACVLAVLERYDNAFLYIAVVSVYQPDVLVGDAWVAVEIFGVGGATENMMAWADAGAQLGQIRDFGLFAYAPTPYDEQLYLHDYMDRPWSTPPWEKRPADES